MDSCNIFSQFLSVSLTLSLSLPPFTLISFSHYHFLFYPHSFFSPLIWFWFWNASIQLSWCCYLRMSYHNSHSEYFAKSQNHMTSVLPRGIQRISSGMPRARPLTENPVGARRVNGYPMKPSLLIQSSPLWRRCLRLRHRAFRSVQRHASHKHVINSDSPPTRLI